MNSSNLLKSIVCIILLFTFFPQTAAMAVPSRIKDIAHIQGVRDNQLVGYGLVVGLDGTGDGRQTRFTTQTLANLLNQEGIIVPARSIQVKNTAAVMVTATLPPFARAGSKIDVTVSSIGDARSLQGGILLMTPLKAANGDVYAVAQGAVSIGGFTAQTGTSSVQKNQPTAGRVPNGGLIERELSFTLQGRLHLRMVLNDADFSTATRLAEAINNKLQLVSAQPLDSRTVEITVPEEYRSNIVRFISEIENETVELDRVAKIVINEKTGTIIFGQEVKIAPVTIVHGALTVEVSTQYDISQPGPFSQGQTVVAPVESVQVTEEEAKGITITEGASVEDVIRALNSIGATPRDILAIIQAIKAAGALQAELEII